MRKILAPLVFAVCVLVMLLIVCAPALLAQNIENQIIAAQYGTWKVTGLAPDSYSFTPTSCRVQGGASFFNAFTVGTPVKIIDSNPSLSETVTPTSVTITNQTCVISIAPVNDHQLPFTLQSATGGLQEALNANMTNPAPNTIVLDNDFYKSVGTANVPGLIAAAKGATNLSIYDIVQAPYQCYSWNGTQYVSACGGTGGGLLGTIQGDLIANNSANTSAVDQNVFVAASPTTGASTISPQTAVNDAAAHNGAAVITPAASNLPFTNTSGVKVLSLAPGTTVRSVYEFGSACDARQPLVTFTAGQSVVNIAADYFYPTDVGKRIEVVGVVSGVPTRFLTTITSLVGGGSSSSSANVQTLFPFSGGNVRATLGTLDTAAVQRAFNAAAARGTNYQPTTAISFPVATCWTDTINYTGASIQAVDPLNSRWLGLAGDDMLTEGDAAANNAVPNYGGLWSMPTMIVDDTIDATQAWQDINESVTTQHAAVYHPGAILTASSNNPTGPGWFQGSGANSSGAYVGAASVTDASAVICVPNAIVAPPVGNKIVFPWLTNGNLFTATISSTSGSCSTGYTARTLSAPMPSGSGSTQAEWFTGLSPQTINANISGSSCPTTITVTNSILPSPATESNVAPQGLFQIDGEQFGYTFRTNAGAPSTMSFSGITCAQNGTARAAHSSGATVFPLNPYQPTRPWPITPTLTAGSVTPSNAAYYPAWNVGNSAFSAYNSNGNLGQIGLLGFSNAIVGNWTVIPSDGISHDHTGFIYMVGLPYSSHFSGLNYGTDYGIVEATPVINTGGSFANSQPTADGTTWYGIRGSSCHVSDLISGGQQTVSDWNTYSDCYSNTTSTYVGAGTCEYFTQGWNDETGAAQSIQSNLTTNNLYCEPENGSAYGTFPTFEFDISKAVHTNMHIGGGGEAYIGGNNQLFVGGNFNQSAAFPALNYGSNNGSEGTQLLFSGNGTGNVYGTNALINYGPNAHFSGAMSATNPGTAPNGSNQDKNNREPWHGKSNESYNTGNTTAPYENSNGGYIPASEFNTNFGFEANPFTVPWHYDSTSPSGGSVGCAMTTNGLSACFSSLWNQSGIKIGPGQRIVGGKYMVYVNSKSTGAATSYQLKIGACSLGDTATLTVPVTSSFGYYSQEIDFTSAYANCPSTAALNVDGIYPSPANDTITFASLDFAPVWQSVTADTLNVTTINGAGVSGCGQSPVTGIKNGYVCPTAGWNHTLASAQGSTDTTMTLDSGTGVPSAGGCLEIDSEIECFTSVTGTVISGLTRGQYGTTAAAHTAGGFPGVVSLNLALAGPGQTIGAAVYGYSGGIPLLVTNPTSAPQAHAGQSAFAVNTGSNETWFDNQGAIHQTNTSAASTMQGSLNVGNHPESPNITDTAQVIQSSVAASMYQPQTFDGGHMGSLNVIKTTNLAAPTIYPAVTPGTNTASWVCTGIDIDGNLIPGATATVTNAPATWAYPTGYQVNCPYAAGVHTFEVWRTAGGGSQGYLGGNLGPGYIYNDYGGTATSTDPSGHTMPTVNGSNPHISVAGTGNPTITLGTSGPQIFSQALGATAPTGCGTTYPNGSLLINTTGSHAATDLLFICNSATSAWLDIQ